MYKYFLITYDLIAPVQNYYSLYEAIKSMAVRSEKIQNAWFIKSLHNAGEIRDALRAHIDGNDKIFVCEIGEWASYNMSAVASLLRGNA